MRNLTRLLFFVTLSAAFAFGNRIDQGSTDDGVVRSLIPCTSTGSNCNQFSLTFFGGQLLSTPPNSTNGPITVVTDIFIFNNSAGLSGVTLFGPETPDFGVFNCSTFHLSASSLGVPCVNLTQDTNNANPQADDYIVDNPDSSGNDVFTWDPTNPQLLAALPTTGPFAGDMIFYVSINKTEATGSLDATYFGGAPYATPASPTPEPSSILFFVTGAAACAAQIRVRRNNAR